MPTDPTPPPPPPHDHPLERRLETAGWALFLILIGALGLVPRQMFPQGVWLLGLGIILLGLAAVRAAFGLPAGGFRVFLGLLALVLGLASFFALTLPVWQVVLILIGLSMLFGAFSTRGARERSRERR